MVDLFSALDCLYDMEVRESTIYGGFVTVETFRGYKKVPFAKGMNREDVLTYYWDMIGTTDKIHHALANIINDEIERLFFQLSMNSFINSEIKRLQKRRQNKLAYWVDIFLEAIKRLLRGY